MSGIRKAIKVEIPRGSIGAPCDCGGYADEMEEQPTKEEINAYDCGRPHACCTGLFKCRICKCEFIAKLAAPDF